MGWSERGDFLRDTFESSSGNLLLAKICAVCDAD